MLLYYQWGEYVEVMIYFVLLDLFMDDCKDKNTV